MHFEIAVGILGQLALNWNSSSNLRKGLFANIGFVRFFFKITLGVRPVHRVKASISTFYPLLLPSSRYLGQSNKEPTHFLPSAKGVPIIIET